MVLVQGRGTRERSHAQAQPSMVSTLPLHQVLEALRDQFRRCGLQASWHMLLIFGESELKSTPAAGRLPRGA